jgi:hypothetical protein
MGRSPSNRFSLPVATLRVLCASVAALAVAIAVASCGSSSPTPSAAAAAKALLKEREFDRYPRGSVERTFLEYWSDLQFQSWADAAAYYDPGFRDFVGTAAVIGAKKVNGSAYPLLRPHIVRVDTDDGDSTVYYTVKLADSSKELHSITWIEDDGNWQIVHDSRLDAELNQFAQNRVEGAVPTEAPHVPSPEAARAGQAASQLQARFLETLLEAEPQT